MGIETSCFVTNMSIPLGQAVGNGLEVIESVDILKGGGPADVIDLVTSQGNSFLFVCFFVLCYSPIRSSRLKAFLRKGVLKICSKFTGEHLCRSAILTKLLQLYGNHLSIWVFSFKFASYFQNTLS